MGTNNFYNKNASKIFAFTCDNELDYENLVENFQCELSDKFGEKFKCLDTAETDGLRSYNGIIIGSVDLGNKFYSKYNLDIYVSIQCVLRSGYYDGGNADWAVIIVINNDKIDYNDIKNLDLWEADDNVRYRAWIENWIKNTADQAIEAVEKIYEAMSTPMKKVGGFSDGTAIYEPAPENKKCFTENHKVLTSNGLILAKELKAGDKIYDSNGKTCIIESIQKGIKVFVTQMEDGLWHVYDKDSRVIIEHDFKTEFEAVTWVKDNDYIMDKED